MPYTEDWARGISHCYIPRGNKWDKVGVVLTIVDVAVASPNDDSQSINRTPPWPRSAAVNTWFTLRFTFASQNACLRWPLTARTNDWPAGYMYYINYTAASQRRDDKQRQTCDGIEGSRPLSPLSGCQLAGSNFVFRERETGRGP